MNKIEEIEKYMREKLSMDEAVQNLGNYENKYNSKDELRAALKNDGYSDDEISGAVDLIGLKKPEAANTNNPSVPAIDNPDNTPNEDTTTQPAQPEESEPNKDTNQENANPENSPVDNNVEQNFANEWTAIVKEVGTIKNNFAALTNDAKAKGYIRNPQVLNKIQGVSGVIASIGSAATMVGTILSFIPGMQGLAMTLRGAGLLAGGLGTAGNRTASSIGKFRSGDKKGGFMDAAMATMGVGSAFLGGHMLNNQFGSNGIARVPTSTNQNTPNNTQDTSKFAQGQVNQVPSKYPIGTSEVAGVAPQGVGVGVGEVTGPVYAEPPSDLKGVMDEIHTLNNGVESDWTHSQPVLEKYGREGVQKMLNTINTSDAGQAMISDNNSIPELGRQAGLEGAAATSNRNYGQNLYTDAAKSGDLSDYYYANGNEALGQGYANAKDNILGKSKSYFDAANNNLANRQNLLNQQSNAMNRYNGGLGSYM